MQHTGNEDIMWGAVSNPSGRGGGVSPVGVRFGETKLLGLL